MAAPDVGSPVMPQATGLLARARYRAGQFRRALRPVLTPADVAVVRDLLGATELALFARMEPADQRHALDLCYWLRRTMPPPGPSRALQQAALLHDVGKGRMRVIDRVAFVVLRAVSETFQRRCAAEHGGTARHAQWTLLHHARIGAERLAAAGVSPRVVALTARHLDPPDPDDPEQRWLIAGDRQT